MISNGKKLFVCWQQLIDCCITLLFFDEFDRLFKLQVVNDLYCDRTEPNLTLNFSYDAFGIAWICDYLHFQLGM